MKSEKINEDTYKKLTVLACLVLGLFVLSSSVFANAVQYKKDDTGLYRDIFDDNLYYEGTSYLRFDRLYRLITGKKKRAMGINVYDEVPDSAFFKNRHGRQRLSVEDLEKGYSETAGPDTENVLTVVKGKFTGLNPGFFIKDSRGDKYLLKFDFVDSFEMRTSAEVITSRFMHAIGYNVPQYTIALFSPDKLAPGQGAKIRDESGFVKDLTAEKLEEYLLFLPQDENGNYRVSASKFLEGENIGYLSFNHRRKDDPNDKIDHRYLREIRAIRVFASWLNNYDQRDSNTIDMVVNENGREYVKHYLIDFNASLGSGTQSPMHTFEHMIDYGEAFKAFLGFGFWKKPWQKRWSDAGEQLNYSPAVGDFDNKYFHPEKYKTQLPYYAFKEMTRADAFWAAKIIMTFTDEDVRAMVKAGKYSDAEDEKYVGDVLIERRDIIGRYWFDQASTLDKFDLQSNNLVFEDLGVKHGFYAAGETSYKVELLSRNSGKVKKVSSSETRGTSIDLTSVLGENESVEVFIRTLRPGSSKPNPYVRVRVSSSGIELIEHQD